MENLIIVIVVCILYWAVRFDFFLELLFGLVIVALIIKTVGSAKAQVSPVDIVPPPQYDPQLHPYTGKLTIRRVDPADTANRCSRQLRQYNGAVAVGCTQFNPYDNSCEVWIVNDYELNRRAVEYEVVLRHELGHCNGWQH